MAAPAAGDTAGEVLIDPAALAFYQRILRLMLDAGIPFLVGGAYSFARYTGIERHTKDFDIFVREADRDRLLALLAGEGCETDCPYPHWLAKARCDDAFVDIIYSSGNGIAIVDDEWFTNAVDEEVLGFRVKLCPVEESIWSKAFIQERERYDGADIAHLIYAQGQQMDWRRLLRRFGSHYRVLFAHLVLFGFIYPGAQDRLPGWVLDRLWRRIERERQGAAGNSNVCRGTLLSRAQYLVDVEKWGMEDARLHPSVQMDEADIELWTAAIEGEDQ